MPLHTGASAASAGSVGGPHPPRGWGPASKQIMLIESSLDSFLFDNGLTMRRASSSGCRTKQPVASNSAGSCGAPRQIMLTRSSNEPTSSSGHPAESGIMSTVATSKKLLNARADVIGSLLRPQYLLDARERLERGELDAGRVQGDRGSRGRRSDRAAGSGRPRRGHRRRAAPLRVLRPSRRGARGLRQVRRLGDPVPRRAAGTRPTLKRPVVVEKLRWRRQMAVEEFTYLRGRTKRPVKVTLISAQQAAAYYDPDKSRSGLSDARRLSGRSRRLHAARDRRSCGRLGCDYVQIDAPQYAALLDETIREGYRQRGSDPDKMLDACIELDNAIIDGHPGITFGIHICRGNHKSMFYASGGYDRIAEQVFTRAALPSLPARVRRRPVGHVRAAASRARTIASSCSGWSARRCRGSNRRRSCGARSPRPSAIVPLERLALSPQCGFASTARGQPAVAGRSAAEARARRPESRGRCGD